MGEATAKSLFKAYLKLLIHFYDVFTCTLSKLWPQRAMVENEMLDSFLKSISFFQEECSNPISLLTTSHAMHFALQQSQNVIHHSAQPSHYTKQQVTTVDSGSPWLCKAMVEWVRMGG